MLRFVFVFLVGIWAGTAHAQQVITIDPNAAEYRPGLLALRGCGFAIGMDPSWSHSARNSSGKVEHRIVGHPGVVGGYGRLKDEFYGNTITVTVTCEPAAPSSDKGQTAYNKTLADAMRDSYASDRVAPLSSVSRAQYGPFRNGYQFDWGTKSVDGPRGAMVGINGNIFAHVGDVRVHVFYRVSSHTGENNLDRLAPGTVIPLSRSVHAKITAPLNVMPSGALVAIRSLDMERRFISRVLATIR